MRTRCACFGTLTGWGGKETGITAHLAESGAPRDSLVHLTVMHWMIAIMGGE